MIMVADTDEYNINHVAFNGIHTNKNTLILVISTAMIFTNPKYATTVERL